MDCAIWKFTCSAIFIVRLVWLSIIISAWLPSFLALLAWKCIGTTDVIQFLFIFLVGIFHYWTRQHGIIFMLLLWTILFLSESAWNDKCFVLSNLLLRIIWIWRNSTSCQGGSYLFQQPIGIYCRNACMNIIFGIYFFLKRFIYFLDWTSLISISVWSILRWLCFNYCEYYLEKRVSIPTQRDAIRMTARLIAVEWDPSTLINYIICLWICSGFPSQINSVCEIGCLFYSIFSCVLSCWSILWGQSCLKFIIFHRYRSLCLVIYSKYHIR